MKARWILGAALAMGAGMAWAARRERQRFQFTGKTAVITGGSRGLGLLLAHELIDQGANVALLARDEMELNRAAAELRRKGGRVLTVVSDVADHAAVERAMDEVATHFGSIDILINNAGIIQVGPVEHVTRDDLQRCLAVHVYGPWNTCMAAAPYLRRAGGGRIVNISSIGGKVAAPHMLPYTTSKFALVGFSDGLRAELRQHNIFVTTVCPGLMRTGSAAQAEFKGQHQWEYAWFSLADALPLVSMRGETAARKILAACRVGAPRLILGLPAKAAVLVNELCPATSAWLTTVMNRFLPGPDAKGSTAARKGYESESWFSRRVVGRLGAEAPGAGNQLAGGSPALLNG